MLKRTLAFSNPVYLSLRNQQLVLAYKDDPEHTTTVPIEDIGVVVVEHQQISITLPLLNALTENEVQVVFCNSKGMPSSMLLGFEAKTCKEKLFDIRWLVERS